MSENPKRTRPIKKLIVDPFNDFVQLESSSGIILFAATIIALIWANSSFGYMYEMLWTDQIGFTMSIFITNLAFIEPEFINAAKFGILIGSIIAGISGYLVLKYTLKEKTA